MYGLRQGSFAGSGTLLDMEGGKGVVEMDGTVPIGACEVVAEVKVLLTLLSNDETKA